MTGPGLDSVHQVLVAALGSMLLFAPYVPLNARIHLTPRYPAPGGAATPPAAGTARHTLEECEAGERPGPDERTHHMLPLPPGMDLFDWPAPFLHVTVEDTPRPQGSKKAFVNPRTQRAVLIEDGKSRLNAWRNAVVAAVYKTPDRPRTPVDAPVFVDVLFVLPRPKSAPKTLVTWPANTATGDVDKLQRATYDALTMAGVWKDDSRVVGVHAWSVYAGHPGAPACPGAVISVYELPAKLPHSAFGTGTLGA